MKINRQKLLNDLQDFASEGNGVIIGSPGIGKTYLLKELRQRLKSTATLHLLLPIDQLGDGTDKDLQQELSLERDDLIEELKFIPDLDKKAILLFDAFDAARNEQTRKRFLHLIRRAIQELDKWNVVVTVRTYDAKKSQELLDLFDNPYDNDLDQYHTEGILCRHFTIPSLNEDEIQQAFDQIPHLKSIYESGSQDFKSLLANPFNLWLLEKTLTISQDVPDFSQIHSEVQLLRLFWQRRIEGVNNADDRHFLLTQVTRRMVEERSLTVRRDNVYRDLQLGETARQMAWNNLLSDEILAKVSSGQSIAFSHNILFDYAISILLIEDDPRKLEEFVLEDPSRPLFLRPSLTYFFTRLWYDDPETFWRAFWYVLPNDQSVHLRLFARLIPTSVIANEARDIAQLTPLLEKLRNREDIGSEAMMRLLQSFRALQIERDELWIDFFDQASAHWHADFAWDLATLTSEILERAPKTENTAGGIGRRLFEWAWKKRKTNGGDWYNRLGSTRAVPLIAKTYGTDIEESRRLLKKVLKLTQEDNFPISFLTWLTEHVDKIWLHDPEFVALIYRAVFTHDETSDERTDFNTGPILPITSTRRQDYSSCQYRLITHFPNFLQADLLVATQAAIRSLNYFIKKNHTGYLRDGVNFKNLIETFEFRGKHAYFVPDHSHIWDETSYPDEPIKIADELFKFIGALASSQNSLLDLDLLLDVFRDEVGVAFFWKRLLKTAAQSPRIFAPRLFELCIAKPIQMGSDVLYELDLFLESATSEFTPTQLLQIENTILALPKEATDENDRKFLEYRRNRLITSISQDLLQTEEAKKIREDMERTGQVPENTPLFIRFTSESRSEPYTEENRLQDQGVDTDAPENQELQRFFGPLDKFTSGWLNGTPTEEAVEEILPQLQEAYATIHRNAEANKAVIDSLWCKLIACVAILSRVTDDPENDRFAFCRQMLLQGAKHELPEPDPQDDAQFDFSMYSPCPRHEAAKGLLRLASRQLDTEMLDAIESLASDPVPSVRMVTAMELPRVYFKTAEKFWHIVEHRAAHETNQTVQNFIYSTLALVVARKKENEDKTVRVMDKLLQHLPQPISSPGQSDQFIKLLIWLAISRENSWALKTIDDTLFKDPIRFAPSLRSAVSRTMGDYVVPKNLEVSERHEEIQRAIAFLKRTIDVASDGIQELCTNFNENRTEEEEEKLREIYTVIDRIIMCLFFEVAYEKDQSEEPKEKISDELRCRFYIEVKPLMEQVIAFAEGENGLMFARTAHYFMQLLTSFMTCNPKEVLHLAEGVARSSERFGYNLDSLAVAEVVKFVEIILADHREEVRDGEGLEDLLNLLDIFAKTGWSDALRLVWRLDEVFR